MSRLRHLRASINILLHRWPDFHVHILNLACARVVKETKSTHHIAMLGTTYLNAAEHIVLNMIDETGFSCYWHILSKDDVKKPGWPLVAGKRMNEMIKKSKAYDPDGYVPQSTAEPTFSLSELEEAQQLVESLQ